MMENSFGVGICAIIKGPFSHKVRAWQQLTKFMKVFAVFRSKVALLLFLSPLVCATEANVDERDGASSAAVMHSGDASASVRTVQLDFQDAEEDSKDSDVQLYGLIKF